MLEELDNIKKDIREYLEIRLDLMRLHIAENTSKILSKSVNIAIVGYLLFFILLFLSFAAGYFFAKRLQSDELGFLCVAGFYILLLVVFLIFRKHIVDRPIIKAVIKLFFPIFTNDEKE
jgi:hypothetical protein